MIRVILLLTTVLFFSIQLEAKTLKTPKALKEWTFMVYLNGDNNLDSFGDKDLEEMMKVGSNGKVNIIVLRDYGVSQSSKIYYVNKGSTKTVKDFGDNVDTGDVNTLVEFFKFAKEKYPSKHYFVDIWNHGGGWVKARGQMLEKGISYDDTSGNYINTPQLGVALDQIKKLNGGNNIDILGMDACFMAMAEVIYEVANTVNYVVASEETELGDGWDYKALLSGLTKKPTMTAEALAILEVTTYLASYSENDGVTQSAISTMAFRKAIPKAKEYVDYAVSSLGTNKEALALARTSAQVFEEYDFRDMTNFLDLANQKSSDQQLKKLGSDLISSLKASIIKSGQKGKPDAQGISIWLPSRSGYVSSIDDYKNLKWTKETGWDELIDIL